jgi:hypothetical protein
LQIGDGVDGRRARVFSSVWMHMRAAYALGQGVGSSICQCVIMTHTYEHEEHGDECDPCKCGWSTRTWNRNMLWLWRGVPWRPAAAADGVCNGQDSYTVIFLSSFLSFSSSATTSGHSSEDGRVLQACWHEPNLKTLNRTPQRAVELVSLDAMPDVAAAAHAGASTCSGALCAAGKYGVAGATSASAAACTDCPAGSYSAETGV